MTKEYTHMAGNEFARKIMQGEKDFRRIELEPGYDLERVEGIWEYLRAHSGENQRSPIDISESDLRGINMGGLCLDYLEGERANLEGASLYDASLANAVLREGNLKGAYLVNADLHDADLSHADMTGANLEETNLRGSHLQRAILKAAWAKDAHFGLADLWKTDLSKACLIGTCLENRELPNAYTQTAILSEHELDEAEKTANRFLFGNDFSEYMLATA